MAKKNDEENFDFFHIFDDAEETASEEAPSEAEEPIEEEPQFQEDDFSDEGELPEDQLPEEVPPHNKRARGVTLKRKHPLPPRIRVILISVGLVLLILALVFLVSKLAKKGAAPADKATVIPLSADSVLGLYPYTDGIAVLKQNSVEYYDGAGNQINSNPHLYMSPSVRTAGKNLLLFDKGGTDLRIEKNSAVYRTLKFEAEVSAAAICDNGTYAYVLNAEGGYQSHLFVFSSKGKRLFEWGGSDYLLDLALSENGRYVAMSFLTVNNAAYSGKIICYAIKGTEPLYTYEFKGDAIYDIEFLSGKRLSVLTDTGLYTVGPKDENTQIASFSANELNHVDFCCGGVSALALNRYGNENNAVVTVFSKKMKKNTEITFTKPIAYALANRFYAALVFSDVIEIFEGDGLRAGRIELNETCLDASLSGRRVFVLCPSGLYGYSASHVDLPETEGREVS